VFVEDYDLSDALLWTLVKKFSRQTKKHTTEDLMSEARAAAAFAIREYRKDKKASMESFIFECVKNRLSDVVKANELDLVFDGESHQMESSYSTEDDINFSLSMKELLTPDEFVVFHMRFVEDYSEREIAKILKTPKGRISKCLHRILLQYLSIEKNHHQILTQRKLAERWLEDSPNSANG